MSTDSSAQEGRFKFGQPVRDKISREIGFYHGFDGKFHVVAMVTGDGSLYSAYLHEHEFEPADNPPPSDADEPTIITADRCSDCWGSGKLYSLPLTGYPVTCRLCGGTGKESATSGCKALLGAADYALTVLKLYFSPEKRVIAASADCAIRELERVIAAAREGKVE